MEQKLSMCVTEGHLGIRRFVESKEKDVKSIKITQKDLEYSINEIKKTKHPS